MSRRSARFTSHAKKGPSFWNQPCWGAAEYSEATAGEIIDKEIEGIVSGSTERALGIFGEKKCPGPGAGSAP